MPKEKPIGKVTHFFGKLGVGIIKLGAPLAVGDEVKIKGHTTDFDQKIDSIQIEHKAVEKAGKGKVVGVKLSDKVREGDSVYKK